MARTILIVEDDKSVARMLTDLLEAEGYRVLHETDGEWGLRTFQHKEIDVVVMDVLVPKLVGFDLVEQLRKLDKGKTTPIIMLSGVYRASVHRQKMSERFGVLEYLDKPVDIDRLLTAIRGALGQSTEPARPRAVTGLISVAPDLSPMEESADAMLRSLQLPVPRRGDLEQVPFPRLIGQLYSARASGALMLRKGSVKKIVYLRQGVAVFIKSNVLGECLGHVMVRERLITEAQCDKSVEKLKAEKRKQGQILIELGYISPHNLEFALERQMELKLFDLFGWLEGKYLFNEKEDYAGASVALSYSPAEMVYEGVRRTMSLDRVLRELGRLEDRIPLPSSDPTFRYQALELNAKAGPLIDAIDGKTRLSELLVRDDTPRELAAVMLYSLACTSLLRFLEAPPVGVQRRSYAPPVTTVDHVMEVDDEEVEPLNTGEVPIDDPALIAIAEARAKARAARDEALRQAEIPQRRSMPPPPPAADPVASAPHQPAAPIAALSTPPLEGRRPPPPPPRSASAGPMPPPMPAPFQPITSLPPAPSSAPPPPVPVMPPPMPPMEALGVEDSSAVNIAELESVDAIPLPVSTGDIEIQGSGTDGVQLNAPDTSDLEVPTPYELMAPEPAPPPAEGPLSDELRSEVRARLEASLTAQLATVSPLLSLIPQGQPERRREPPPPPREAGARPPRLELEEDRRKLKQELEQALLRLEKKGYYERLNVHRLASSEEIEAAFKTLARSHHPDRVVPGSAPRELVALAERIYVAYAEAKDALLHPDERAAYDRRTADDSEDLVAPFIEAEGLFQRGLELEDRGDWAQAVAVFERAYQLHPERGAYLAHLAWALFSADPDDDDVPAQALADLERAAQIDPTDEQTFVFLGLIKDRLGQRDAAIQSLKQAVAANPDSVRALRALRALMPPPEKKTGLFGLKLS
ncbi:MAG: response regulator [Myxococcota bacterium]